MLRLHFASTGLLVGLIWLIQVFVYPQFLRMKAAEFSKYHLAECLGAGLVVFPAMVIEAGTAVYLLYRGHREWPFLAGVALILIIWLSTAVVQAPLHARLLMHGFDAAILRRLIRTNWLRTIAWTVRGILVASLLWTV